MPAELYIGEPDSKNFSSLGTLLPGCATGFMVSPDCNNHDFVAVKCKDEDDGVEVHTLKLDEHPAVGSSLPAEMLTKRTLVKDIKAGGSYDIDIRTYDGYRRTILVEHAAQLVVAAYRLNYN